MRGAFFGFQANEWRLFLSNGFVEQWATSAAPGGQTSDGNSTPDIAGELSNVLAVCTLWDGDGAGNNSDTALGFGLRFESKDLAVTDGICTLVLTD